MQTLGDVITLVLVIAGVLFVPWVLFRAWIVPLVRPVGAMARQLVMSRLTPVQPHPPEMIPVSIPVWQYGMDDPGMAGMDADAADIDAKQTEAPRVSRNLTEDEIVVLLAVQRAPDGKPRYSANRIAQFIGGDRNHVLAIIRDVRSGTPAPIYRPLTPEQQTARAELGLEHKA